MTFIIFPVKIYFALINQIINAIYISSSYSIENWCLSFMIYLIWVTSSFNNGFHNLWMSLTCSIKNGCLSITIYMIGLATILKEKLDKLQASFSANIKQTCLIDCILKRSTTFGNIDQIHGHIAGFLLIWYQDACKQCILVIRWFICQERYIIWLVKS